MNDLIRPNAWNATGATRPEDRVTLLLDARGQVVAIYRDEAEAAAKAARYNADPHLDAETPDEGAPYTTETWGVW